MKPPPKLPAGPNVRDADPATSHDAADRNPEVRAHDQWNVLLAHFRNPAGLTDYELAAIVGRQQNSCGKRRGELRDCGMIEETTLRRLSPTQSPIIVWRITSQGISYVRSQWPGVGVPPPPPLPFPPPPKY